MILNIFSCVCCHLYVFFEKMSIQVLFSLLGRLFGVFWWGSCMISQFLNIGDEFKTLLVQEFRGSPVVRSWCFHCCDPGSVPGWGTKIPQAEQFGQKTNKQKVLWAQFGSWTASLQSLVSSKSTCSPFYRWWSRGSERPSDLPRAALVTVGKTMDPGSLSSAPGPR